MTLEDGLRIIVEDKDINVRGSLVHSIKNFVVYFNHENIIGGVNQDDVVGTSASELPKMTYLDKKVSEKLPDLYTNLEMRNAQQCTTKGDEKGGSNDNDMKDKESIDTN